MHLKKIIKLNILFFFFISYSLALEGEKTYQLSNEKIIVTQNKITLLDNSNKPRDVYSLDSWEIKDSCMVPPGRKLLVILGRKEAPRGERLALFSVDGGKIKQEWLGEDHGYNPWKIMAADVDGDGQIEICLGMWKQTRFHPVFDNRLFIYNWDGEGLTPKWLGSRLSQPFIDYDFKDIDGDGVKELIALERQRNNLKRVMSYKWSGFGFEGYKVLKEDLEIEKLTQFKP